MLFVATSGFVMFMFLPSVMEVFRSRSDGPRRILKKTLRENVRQHVKKNHEPSFRGNDFVKASKIAGDIQGVLSKSGAKSQRIGRNTVRILGDFEFPPNLGISENIIVEGSLRIGDNCSFSRNVKAKGKISVGSNVIVKGNLICHEDVDLKDDVVIGGSVHARDSVRLGENGYVGLSIVTDGDVEMFENCEVKGSIIANGIIKMRRHPELDFPSGLDKIG